MTSLILSLLIDAEKGRDVATADVVGVNLMTDMKDKVIVKLTGDAVDIMCEVNKNIFLSYQEKKEESNLRKTKKGIIWVYVVCNYMVQYFKDCLTELVFKINNYDPYVANTIIEGKQCTICWYVDDSKTSHVSPKVVD